MFWEDCLREHEYFFENSHVKCITKITLFDEYTAILCQILHLSRTLYKTRTFSGVFTVVIIINNVLKYIAFSLIVY